MRNKVAYRDIRILPRSPLLRDVQENQYNVRKHRASIPEQPTENHVWSAHPANQAVRLRPGERIRASPVLVRLYVSGWASARDSRVHCSTVSQTPVHVAYASGVSASVASHWNDARRSSCAPDSLALRGDQKVLRLFSPGIPGARCLNIRQIPPDHK